MATRTKKLRPTQVIAHPGLVSWPAYFVNAVDLDGTVTRDFPVQRVLRKMRLVKASWTQELDVDGAKDVKLRNATKAVDLTAVLDIAALAADAGADFVLTSTLVDRDVKPGDVVLLVYTVTTAGVVAPGEATVACEWELLE